jgi:predicted transcriptional regulator
MNLGFRTLKLFYKLLFLITIPSFITIATLAFFLWKDLHTVIGHPILFTCAILLFVTYIVLALFFIRSLSKGIEIIENASVELASGKFSAAIDVTGFPETSKIGAAINNLKDDLNGKTRFAEQIKTGNFEAIYAAHHEHDLLGQALLGIKENLIAIKQEDQQRNWASQGLAKFVEVLQSAKNLKDLSNDIIVNLVRIILANQGAIYILVKDKAGEEFLEMHACYAYNRSKHLSQQIALGEGIIGQAFLEKETIYLKEVPDRFIRITSGLGEANPRHILIVPLKMNETIVGIVELASFTAFSKHEIAFVEKIGESIAYAVSSIRIAENTQGMLDDLHKQTEQMREQ